MLRLTHVLALTLTPLSALTQTPPAPTPKAPTGSITGHILCEDTNTPARFATVISIPIPVTDASGKTTSPKLHSGSMVRTGLQGEYTINGLEPGDYLVVADLAGYIPPLAGLGGFELHQDKSKTITKLLTEFTPIHVVAGQTSKSDFALHRGGTIHGHVTYDDGSPAPVTMVSVEVKADDGKFRMLDYLNLRETDKTDTDGNYQIAGLPEGKYLVTAWVHVCCNLDNPFAEEDDHISDDSWLGNELQIFPPSTLHKKAAELYEIKPGEQQQVDITIPLDGLHAISGTAMFPPQAWAKFNGEITAKLADDPDFGRSAFLLPDGTFHFNYMPSGKYTLTLRGQHSGAVLNGPSIEYTSPSVTIILGDADVTNVVFTIPPDKPKATITPAS